MKLQEHKRALTKRDLVTKLQKVEKALGAQAQRADEAERECIRLRRELIRANAEREAPMTPTWPAGPSST